MKTTRHNVTSRPPENRGFNTRRAPSVLRGSIALLAASAASLLTASSGQAATYYWDTTATGLWQNGANWSNAATSGGATGVVPLATDLAVFNQSSVNGPEIVQLGAATAIMGITFINTGTTQLQANTFGAQPLTVGTGGLTVNAGAGAVTIGDANNQVPITLGGAQTWTNNSANPLTILDTITNGANLLTIGGTGTTVISGSFDFGTGGITLGGTATLTLSGFNNYSGTTNLGVGRTLNFNSSQAIGTGPLTIAGGTLNNTSGDAVFNANSNAINVNGNFTFTGAADLQLGSGAVTLTAARTFTVTASTLTLGGNVSGAGFGITKAGAGTLALNGVIGTTTGGLSVTGGTLVVGSAANTFTGNITVAGATSVLQINAATNNATSAPLGIFTGGTAYKTVTLTNGGAFRPNVTYNVNLPSAALPGNGYVFVVGAGGGRFDVPGGVTFTIDDGIGAGTALANAQLQGSGLLTKTGDGTLSLGNGTSNFSNFTGAILVSGGTLTVGGTSGGVSPFGATSAGTTIAAGADFNLNGSSNTAAEPLTISGGGVNGTTNVIRNSSATAASFAGPITLAGPATVGVTSAGGISLNGAIALGANTLTIRNMGTGRTATAGLVSGTGGVVMDSFSTGDYLPAAIHTYTGGTTLLSGFTAVPGSSTGTAGSPTSGPFGAGVAPLDLAGGQIRSSNVIPVTIGNTVTISNDTTFYNVGGEKTLTFSGPVTLAGGTRTLTSNVGNSVTGTTVLFTGAIGDGLNGLGLTKDGTGNLTLAGANTYTGGTMVNAGNLTLTGSVASNTALTVLAGGTFSLASGSANPLTTVSALDLGAGFGTTNLFFDLGANTAGSDRIVTAAPAFTSNNIALNVVALPGLGSSATYDLISAPSGLSGATYSLSGAGGFFYTLNTSDSLVQVGVTAAPGTGNLYWSGSVSNSWSSFSGSDTNFSIDAAGAINAGYNPTVGNSVIFSAANAASPIIATTLDNNFAINDLQFTSSPAGITTTSIAPGTTLFGSLTIAPASSAAGISVGANAGAVSISAPVIIGASQTWSVNGTGANGSSLSVSGGIGGAAGNTLAINGLVTLSAPALASTFSGITSVGSGGLLVGGATNSFSANSPVNVSGTGIVRLNGLANNVAALSGNGTVQNNSAATATTLTIGDASTTADFSGTLQNGGAATLGLTKVGTNIQTLSGTNTYTGATAINLGTLRAGSNTAFNNNSILNMSATGVLDLGGFTATFPNIATSAATNVIINSGAADSTLNLSAFVNTIVGLVTDGPTNRLAVNVTNANAGNTVFTLNRPNTFSGGLTLLNGSALGAGTRLRIPAAVTTVGTPGAITSSPFGTGPITIGLAPTDRVGVLIDTVANITIVNDLVFNTALGTDIPGFRVDTLGHVLSGTVTANLANATFTAGGASTSAVSLTGRVTGQSGLAASATTTGSLTVTLNNAAGTNDYQGNTLISNAQNFVVLGAPNQIPNGAGRGNVVNNGVLRLNGFSETINGLSGAGTVDGLSGTPTLIVGDNNATATFSGVLQNTAGALGITKIGSGTQTLSGNNTFAGVVSANGGRLAFTTSANLGSAAATNTVTLNGGALSYTGVGAADLTATRVVTIGASGGTLETTVPTGTLTLSGGIAAGSTGGLTKTGAGTVVIPGTTGWTGANFVNVSAGTLRAGFGASGISALTVGAMGNMDFRNNATQTLTLGAGAGAITLSGGSRLGFELNGGANDGIVVPGGGSAITGGVVTLDFFNFGSGVVAGTYNLLSAPGGLDTATYALGTAPLGFNYTINKTASLVSLTTVAYVPRFWTGAVDNSWSTSPVTNWSADPAGAIAASVPNATHTVVFSAANAVGPAFTTTLDAAFTVDSLQFLNVPVGITAVTVNPGAGGTLALAPASSSAGIFVGPNAGTATIVAPLTVAASQTWNVDGTGANGSSLVISGNTAFNAPVRKIGAGAVTLSGSNSGSAPITLAAGTLNIGSATALGTGLLTIGAGTTIDASAGAVTLSTNNAQNWNGSFTFAGTQSLDLGTGAVTLVDSATVSVAGSPLTVRGVISDGGNNRSLTKDGTGDLILTASNTYTGGTTINGGGLTLNGANNVGTGAVTVNSGTLNIGAASALGTAPLVINGGMIDNTDVGPLTLTGSNPVTVNGSFAFGGTNDLNLGTGAVTLFNNPTITVASSTLTLGGPIAGGSSGLTKAGPGTLNLAGAASYSGTTAVNAGTLSVGTDQTFAGVLVLGVNGTATPGAFDATNGSATFTALTVQTNSPTPNTITIGSGRTLTVNGNVSVGNTVSTGTGGQTVLNFDGGGALVVNATAGTFNIGNNIGTTNNSARATVNLSALSSFTANLGTGTFAIQPNGDNSSSIAASTLTLSDTANSITAAAINVGPSSTGALQRLILGAGTNVLRADALNLGTGGRDTGQLRFLSTGGSVTLRNRAGTGRANVTLGPTAAQTTAYTTASLLDTTGNTADLAIGTLAIDLGAKTANNTNDVNFDNGTLDVRIINMAVAKGTGTSVSTIRIGGGTVRFGGSAAFGDAGTGSVSLAAAATGELAITGGTVTSTVDITKAAGAGNAILTLDGGTLDLTGRNLGGNNAITTLNFLSGTLQNVGQINNGGAGVNKASPGELTLAGTLTYTGETRVSEGTLNVNGTLGNGSNLFFADAGVTNFNVSQTLGGLEIGAGAVVNLSASAGPTPGAEPHPGLLAGSIGANDFALSDPVQAVPEPGTLSLLATAMLGFLSRRRRPAR